MTDHLLEVHNLVKKYVPNRHGLFGRPDPILAVNDVSFDISRGQTVALVGESGSGKSTTGRCVLRLIEPTSGSVLFDGIDLSRLSQAELRSMRSRMQIIFQDTYASLDPRWRIGKLLREPLAWHTDMTPSQQTTRVHDVLKVVGLQPEHETRYPHEFSGGQRQRIGIARALMLNPELIVCDEPVSALDVSVQAQVLNLMKDLQGEFGLTYLFISHDLSVVRFMADEILAMCNGEIVEQGPTDQVFAHPQHAYTRALLAAIPEPDPRAHEDRAEKRRILREGLVAAERLRDA